MIQTNTIHITTELLALVAEIDEFKGAWRALGTLEPERLKALRHIATIEVDFFTSLQVFDRILLSISCKSVGHFYQA